MSSTLSRELHKHDAIRGRLGGRMSDVFISYSKQDVEIVRELADALIAEGFDVWWDNSLLSGDEWRAEVQKQLHASTITIVCWSKAASESRWVTQEAEEARRLKKLVPVVFESDEGGRPAEPPFGFRDIQATSLLRWQSDRRHEYLLPLITAIERVPSAPTVPARFRRLRAELVLERERRATLDERSKELSEALDTAQAKISVLAQAKAAVVPAAVVAPATSSARTNVLLIGACVVALAAALMSGATWIDQRTAASEARNGQVGVVTDLATLKQAVADTQKVSAEDRFLACAAWFSQSSRRYSWGTRSGALASPESTNPLQKISDVEPFCKIVLNLEESLAPADPAAAPATPAPATH